MNAIISFASNLTQTYNVGQFLLSCTSIERLDSEVTDLLEKVLQLCEDSCVTLTMPIQVVEGKLPQKPAAARLAISSAVQEDHGKRGANFITGVVFAK